MTNSILFGFDKQMHFLGFLSISFVVGLFLLFVTPKHYLKQNISLVWFTLILIGIFEEYRQYRLPNRTAELLDAMANFIGVSLGLIIPYIIACFYRQKGHATVLALLFLCILIPISIGLWHIDQRPVVLMNDDFLTKIVKLFAGRF